MIWDYTPYMLPPLLAAVIAAWLARYAWQRRSALGSTFFAVLTMAVAEWVVAYALELAAVDLAGKVLWARLQYVGMTIVPVAWILLSLELSGRERWITRRHAALLAAVPLIAFLLVLSNDSHQLIWRQITLDPQQPVPALVKQYGLFFWIKLAYAYSLLFVGTLLLIQTIRHSVLAVYRWQALVLLIGVLAPWLCNALYVFAAVPNLVFDLTIIGFMLSGVVVALGVLRYHLFDIVPVARRTIVGSMRDGIFVLDMGDRVVDLNASAEGIARLTSSEAVGQPIRQVLPSAGIDQFLAGYHGTGEERAEIVWEHNQEQGHYELQLAPLHDERGQLRGRLLILRDITERKRAARRQTILYETLRTVSRHLQSETAAQSALEAVLRLTDWTMAAILVPDEAGEALTVQAAGGALAPVAGCRVPLKSVSGRAFLSAETQYVPDVTTDPDYIDANALAAVENGSGLSHEGAQRLSASQLAVPLRHGSRLLGILSLESTLPQAFSMDDIRLAESLAEAIALALDNARLFRVVEDERSRLAALITASRDGIILIGTNQDILVMNEPARQFLNLPDPAGAWLNRPLNEMLAQLQDQIDAANPALAELFHLPGPGQGELPAREGEIELPPHMLHWLNVPVTGGDVITGGDTVSGGGIAAGSEIPIGRLIALRDVTGERQFEQAREDLTHTMVHDLRNPLNNILGAQEMLSNMGALTADQQEVLLVAHESTRRMLAMVNSILDINRLESGRMDVNCRPLDLEQAIAGILQNQLPLARQKEIELAQKLQGFGSPAAAAGPEDPPLAWADNQLIGRVLQNLVDNALRFTPAGGRVLVSVVPDETAGWLRIAVEDSGPGIEPELQGRLFRKFTTGQRPDSGSGLGLAFCKMAVEAHGGRIWLESRPERGTTVYFTLETAAQALAREGSRLGSVA
jgi:PAS domain S-box-containing protein